MADKGVLFSAPMILALLAGRKTQTRRLAKAAEMAKVRAGDMIVSWPADQVQRTGAAFRPAYLVGDRLWVREEWSIHAAFDGIRACDVKAGSMLYTRADGVWHHSPEDGNKVGRRRASMHMPRKLSRITLTVTDVLVERLQSISEADAFAEGVPEALEGNDGDEIYCQTCKGFGVHAALGHGLGVTEVDCRDCATATQRYANLWNSLRPREGERWQDNPWVVAYSFDVRLGNIDEGQS